jgi:hypothetical protein
LEQHVVEGDRREVMFLELVDEENSWYDGKSERKEDYTV